MNINRIFDENLSGNFDETGEIRLSKHYVRDSGEKFIVLKAVNKVNARLIMTHGFPFSIGQDKSVTLDGVVLSKHIMDVFELSANELGQFEMCDYMTAMNHICNGFGDE